MTWFQVMFWLTVAAFAVLYWRAWRWTDEPDRTDVDRLHQATVRVVDDE